MYIVKTLSKLSLGLSIGCLSLAINNTAVQASSLTGKIIVTNRSNADFSVIDVATDTVIKNVALPMSNMGDLTPEPMYVSYIAQTHEIAINDRSNQRVVFFNANTYEVTSTVPTGEGSFHIWANPHGTQLWVNNSSEDTATIIDTVNKSVVTTVSMPTDFQTGMPHDVIYDPDPGKNFAYVSILGLGLNDGINDVIVKFDTTDFTVVDFQEVGLAPHLSATSKNEFLYVPAQNSDEVRILNRDTLDIVKTLDFEGAHGTGMSPDGSVFCTTNFPGGTEDTLSCIDTAINEIAAGNPIDTPVERAHNLVFNGDGTKLYVTHSSTDLDLVSFYSVEDKAPTLLGTVNTGTNPFGIAFVPNPVPEPSPFVGLITTISIMVFSRSRENQSDD